MSWAVEARVKGSHKLVLMLLAEAHNGHTGACFPSQEWIEQKSGLGDSTVSNCLKDLEEWGLLTRHTKALGRGKGSRRDFELHLDVLDPQILEVYNLGIRPPDFTPLDPQILPPVYEEEPEVNRKEPERAGGREDYSETLKAIWDAAPQPSRERSSKKRLAEAVGKIIKGRTDVTPDQLLAAWQAFLRTPDARKEQGRFCPGIHVWLNDNRFDAFIRSDQPAPAQLPLAPPAEEIDHRLDWCFERFAKGEGWHGGRYAWPWEPDMSEAAGHYPEALYTKHGVKRPPQGAAA